MNRLEIIKNQILPNNTSKGKNPDDVVIVAAFRTPLIKSNKGNFKDTSPEVLLTTVLKAILEKTKLDPAKVDDIIVGNVSQPGAGAITSRMAEFLAGFPATTTLCALSRLCSSGLEACATIAAKIRAGQISIGIGAGVESMTKYQMGD